MALLLEEYKERDTIVLGLPRGGVPVAYEISEALNAPLDVFIVRKLGVPGQEELAMGAIASGGITVLNYAIIRSAGVSDKIIQHLIERESEQLDRQEKLFRSQGDFPDLQQKIVILVDDGLATGSTMRAAVRAVRQKKPQKITVAVPVAAPSTCHELRDEVDSIVCAFCPDPFYAVGFWYDHFTQITDSEVQDLLHHGTGIS